MMQRMTFGTAALVLALGLACGGGPGTTDSGGGSTGSGGGGSTGEPGTTSATTGGATTSDSGTGGQTGSTTGEPGTTTTGPGTTTTTTGPGTTTGTTGEPGTTAQTTGGSTGPGLCDEFVPPGCVQSGCPENKMCDTQEGCNPSSCDCDPQTGDVICTPDCGGGTCVCAKPDCDIACEFGFETDEDGCEICQCKQAPGCACDSDDDCVKASPGCCSCNMGGTEVAIAKACIDQLEKCPLPPDEVVCPAVYKCTDAQAVCVQGACVLQ
jgi:hypothetical protein